MLEIDLLTLFPAMVAGPLGESIPRRIQDRGIAEIRVRDLREWGLGKHRTVDDYTARRLRIWLMRRRGKRDKAGRSIMTTDSE